MSGKWASVAAAGLCSILAVLLPACTRTVRPPGEAGVRADATSPVKIVIDSGNVAAAEASGAWKTGAGGDDWGDGCRFALKGAGECKFIWRPALPQAGDYRVSVWFGGDPYHNHASNSPFTVSHARGTRTFKLDQRRPSVGWKVLGVFPFEAGKSGCVELTNDANGNVIADAVQFELVKEKRR